MPHGGVAEGWCGVEGRQWHLGAPASPVAAAQRVYRAKADAGALLGRIAPT